MLLTLGVLVQQGLMQLHVGVIGDHFEGEYGSAENFHDLRQQKICEPLRFKGDVVENCELRKRWHRRRDPRS